MTLESKRDLSLINCIATSMLAYFLTVPVHELFHLLTSLAYGSGIAWFSAGAVQDIPFTDYSTLAPFDRIMVAGGSASIFNAIISVVLVIVLFKVKMRPMMRVFFIQYMGAQMSQGIGYFMIGGFFAAGDWGGVFSCFSDSPGTVTAMRIILSVIGGGGIVAEMFLLNHFSYEFIEDHSDKKERMYAASRLHLAMFVTCAVIGPLAMLKSPAMETGELDWVFVFLTGFMWIPFLWGFLFTGVMYVLPPKVSRFEFKLPEKANYIALGFGIFLILIDIFVFGPGIQL